MRATSVLLLALALPATALVSTRRAASPHGTRAPRSYSVTRHSASRLVSALALATVISAEDAFASGGATAGRTTSIPTAKKRYYARITADVKQFLQMGRAISEGSLGDARVVNFWSEGADDLKSAGYLLAVAFKIDARIPPQKIQQKRDHDALMASLEHLKTTTSGSDAKAAQESYKEALGTLDKYLAGVELPKSSDPLFQ